MGLRSGFQTYVSHLYKHCTLTETVKLVCRLQCLAPALPLVGNDRAAQSLAKMLLKSGTLSTCEAMQRSTAALHDHCKFAVNTVHWHRLCLTTLFLLKEDAQHQTRAQAAYRSMVASLRKCLAVIPSPAEGIQPDNPSFRLCCHGLYTVHVTLQDMLSAPTAQGTGQAWDLALLSFLALQLLPPAVSLARSILAFQDQHLSKDIDPHIAWLMTDVIHLHRAGLALITSACGLPSLLRALLTPCHENPTRPGLQLDILGPITALTAIRSAGCSPGWLRQTARLPILPVAAEIVDIVTHIVDRLPQHIAPDLQEMMDLGGWIQPGGQQLPYSRKHSICAGFLAGLRERIQVRWSLGGQSVSNRVLRGLWEGSLLNSSVNCVTLQALSQSLCDDAACVMDHVDVDFVQKSRGSCIICRGGCYGGSSYVHGRGCDPPLPRSHLNITAAAAPHICYCATALESLA